MGPLIASNMTPPAKLTEYEQVTIIIMSFGVVLFGAWNLYWGLRSGKTWCAWVWPDIDRRKTPWNFRVAIFGWVWLTLGFGWAFVTQISKFVSR